MDLFLLFPYSTPVQSQQGCFTVIWEFELVVLFSLAKPQLGGVNEYTVRIARKNPCSYMKTTISGLTLKPQGTITVSTIKEIFNLLSFNGNERPQLQGVKNYTVCMARRSPVHSLKTTISGWTVKKQGSTTV